jgi:putative hydrolase of the HAD superfamily
MSLKDIKVIGFDADDTLWINETYFREAEECFFDLYGRLLTKT